MFKIEAIGDTRRVLVQIKDLANRNQQGIRNGFYRLGNVLRRTAKEMILEKPRFGRVYRINRNGRIKIHTASRPGEAPANDTGQLFRSVIYEVSGSDSMKFGYRSNLNPGAISKKTAKGVNYGKYLERGTNKMKPRPGLLLAIKKNEGNAVEYFEQELKEEMSKK
jgi:HK97 gp10 family phage protein